MENLKTIDNLLRFFDTVNSTIQLDIKVLRITEKDFRMLYNPEKDFLHSQKFIKKLTDSEFCQVLSTYTLNTSSDAEAILCSISKTSKSTIRITPHLDPNRHTISLNSQIEIEKMVDMEKMKETKAIMRTGFSIHNNRSIILSHLAVPVSSDNRLNEFINPFSIDDQLSTEGNKDIDLLNYFVIMKAKIINADGQPVKSF